MTQVTSLKGLLSLGGLVSLRKCPEFFRKKHGGGWNISSKFTPKKKLGWEITPVHLSCHQLRYKNTRGNSVRDTQSLSFCVVMGLILHLWRLIFESFTLPETNIFSTWKLVLERWISSLGWPIFRVLVSGRVSQVICEVFFFYFLNYVFFLLQMINISNSGDE